MSRGEGEGKKLNHFNGNDETRGGGIKGESR